MVIDSHYSFCQASSLEGSAATTSLSLLRDTTLGSLELLKEGDCLTNLEVEASEVVKVTLDLLDGEVDEHTSDLGSKAFANELFNIWVDEFTDHLLEVGVLSENGWEVTETLLVVSVNLGVRVGKIGGT